MIGGGNPIASLFVRLGADIRGYRAGMKRAQMTQKQTISQMEARQRKFAGMMKIYWTMAAVAAVAAVVKMGKAAIELNEGMANVATLIPGNIRRIKELRKNVQGMAVEFGKSTKDLTEGLYQVVSAFQDSAETADMLRISAMAATAGLSTTVDALNLISAVTKGYGEVNKYAAEKAADLAFYTVKMGQTTFPQLARTMGRAIPMGAALKVKVEELFAAYATLTGVTGDAARVTTQMVGIMKAFIKPSTAMLETIDKLGYKTVEMMIAELGLVGALRTVIGTTDGTAVSIGKLFANARAMPGIFALIGGQAEVFDKKLKGAAETTGLMTEAFGEQTKGINSAGFAWKQLGQEIKTTMETIGQGLGFLPRLLQGVLKQFKYQYGPGAGLEGYLTVEMQKFKNLAGGERFAPFLVWKKDLKDVSGHLNHIIDVNQELGKQSVSNSKALIEQNKQYEIMKKYGISINQYEKIKGKLIIQNTEYFEKYVKSMVENMKELKKVEIEEPEFTGRFKLIKYYSEFFKEMQKNAGKYKNFVNELQKVPIIKIDSVVAMQKLQELQDKARELADATTYAFRDIWQSMKSGESVLRSLYNAFERFVTDMIFQALRLKLETAFLGWLMPAKGYTPIAGGRTGQAYQTGSIDSANMGGWSPGQSAAPAINFNVVNNTPAQVSVNESKGSKGQINIDMVIEEKFKQSAHSGALDPTFRTVLNRIR